MRTPVARDRACLRTGRAWLLEADVLLSTAAEPSTGAPSTGAPSTGAPSTGAPQAFVMWRDGGARSACRLPPPYADCLAHFVGVLTRMHPHLFAWTTLAGLPRTNNDRERFIRAMKTRYRRMSGRKNWQADLLRYGQRIAFYEAPCLTGAPAAFERHVRQVAYALWPHARLHHRPLAHRLRTQFRFTHRRADMLRALEERWAQAPDST